jgi:hypothetical protein
MFPVYVAAIASDQIPNIKAQRQPDRKQRSTPM